VEKGGIGREERGVPVTNVHQTRFCLAAAADWHNAPRHKCNYPGTACNNGSNRQGKEARSLEVNALQRSNDGGSGSGRSKE